MTIRKAKSPSAALTDVFQRTKTKVGNEIRLISKKSGQRCIDKSSRVMVSLLAGVGNTHHFPLSSMLILEDFG